MKKPLIDIREGRVTTVFWQGNLFKLEPDGESVCRCQKVTEHGLRSVGASVLKLLNWTYQHPEAVKKVRRFPRLPLPRIVLKAGDLTNAIDRAEEALLDHCEELGIFQRAGELVRIISLPEGHEGERLRRPKGSVQLESVSNTALTEVFNRIASWRQENPRSTYPYRLPSEDCCYSTYREWGPGAFRLWRELSRLPL